MSRTHAAAAFAALVAFAAPRVASACGCFAMSSPATPVVQAGERILFAHENGEVIAYIQIKYQGAADQFGWIVPLPSVPTLTLGTDEMFAALDGGTQPQYALATQQILCDGTVIAGGDSGGCGFGGGGGTGDATDLGFAEAPFRDMGARGPDIAVAQASLGPYDYAVLKADDESAMLTWLSDNGFFVPASTSAAVMPYIHPGGYFLALKLRGGQTTGDLVPIVLHYASDLPMIPITLTQVGAVEDMGVLVWVLGEARAIPRNYYDVVLDDMPVWLSNVTNYNLQLIDAVHEAPGKHGFITQYAGGSGVMRRLSGAGRFGDPTTLRAITSPAAYVDYLGAHGFAFDGTLLSILLRYIPEPPSLIAKGISPGSFYANIDPYASLIDLAGDPDGGAGMLDAGALTDEIWARIVGPAQDTDALFSRHPYLTRMYTALSPIDMTIDPVFSFNVSLPEVPLLHSALLTTPCKGDPWLHADGGFEVQYPGGLPPLLNLPAALRVQQLRDAGPPILVQDNRDAILRALGPVSHGSGGPAAAMSSSSGCGCHVGGGRVRGDAALLLVLAAGGLALRRARRRARG